ncbi:caspase family protein [Nodosilinea sp. LEGE 07088]|uniref:caspase family protein n=1 Tax=Nodosilinea sp. LEGE 07088 TaxID=2777968 RepID=UPI00187E5042|nr:caspase family protein [Nodosilinea sp. LEGE 07088]MBE9138949.1 caspase family protein [Nodosilinea sp. LEGE 07088]
MARYALIIGISEYDDPHLKKLSKPEKDAETIATLFENYGNCEQVTVLKGRVTTYELGEALQTLLLKQAINNEVRIYFTGHGITVKEALGASQGFLATSDCEVTLKNGQPVGQQRAISFSSLNDLVKRSQLSNLLMLIDACHSGDLIERELVENGFSEFKNKKDYHLITACRNFEEAKAKRSEKHSVFTGAVLEALKPEKANEHGCITGDRLLDQLREALRGTSQEPIRYGAGRSLEIIRFQQKPFNTASSLTSSQSSDIEAKKLFDDGNSTYIVFDEDFLRQQGERQEASILKLRTATWALITQGNYIDRDQQDDLMGAAEQLRDFRGISLILLRGEPGSGKTALQKWIAYKLLQEKHLILIKQEENSNWLQILREFSKKVNGQHFYVVIDNIFRHESVLEGLEQSPLPFSFTLIGTTRPSEDYHENLIGLGYQIKLINIKRPSKSEKRRIVFKVSQDPEVNARLARMSSADKSMLMNAPSMLVLMLQLTEGKPFEQVIAEIIKSLPNSSQYPAYQIFGLICSFYQHGISVPSELLLPCLDKSSEEAVYRVIDSIEIGELSGLVCRSYKKESFNLGVMHELIAQKALELRYKPRHDDNPPYSYPGLFQHFCKIVEFLNPYNENHRIWLSNALFLLVKRDAEAVRKILTKHTKKVTELQNKNTITNWLVWKKIYEELHWCDEQLRCQNEILSALPVNSAEGTYWLSLVEKNGDFRRKQEAMSEILGLLRSHQENRDLYSKYLAFVRKHGSFEQQQQAVALTDQWLQDHPYALEVCKTYFILLDKMGEKDKVYQLITDKIEWMSGWLQIYPEDQNMLKQFRTLIRDHGLPEQQNILKQRLKNQVTDLFNKSEGDRELLIKYLSLTKRSGTFEEIQKAIQETVSWLEDYPDDSNVRVSGLVLIKEQGTEKQKQEAIDKTSEWLLENPNAGQDVLLKYLDLIAQSGSSQHKKGAIAFLKKWLQTHPEDLAARKNYLRFILKINVSNSEIQAVANEQWSWMKIQGQIDLELWYTFLTILQICDDSSFISSAIKKALEEHPKDKKINCKIFSLFEQYLDLDTCFKIANFIYKSYKKPRTYHYKDLVRVANFFCEYGQTETARSIYQKLIALVEPKISVDSDQLEFQNLLKYIYVSSHLGFARALLMSGSPRKIADRLSVVLELDPGNSDAYWIIAKSYWKRGISFYGEAVENFQKAINISQAHKELYWHELGRFYCDALNEKNKARECFENSLMQKINMASCISLVELEIEEGNFFRAKELLKEGLSLKTVTRRDHESLNGLRHKIQKLESLVKSSSQDT